ncbi:hypothetical protein YTPLAS18_34470 [Nitrospira sp.]|nr:hypothetical protein YTPLAS18_34470 [Nitrospira sp.]
MLAASLAVGWAFYQMFLLDVPIARFVRSLQHPLGFLLDPWLAQLSFWGDRLGGGIQLVLLSIFCWVIGRMLSWRPWQLAGLQSLLAHALVAVLTNVMKRTIGRPRPKFSHAGDFQLWPSLDNGFDSFPSGHASASFAVATVLAVHFPRTRWIWYGLAATIASSRVIRSSHFPTDVIAGAAIGFAVGWLLSHPLAEWHRSLVSALHSGAPWLVGLYGTFWVATHPLERDTVAMVLFGIGTLLVVTGIVGRVHAGMQHEDISSARHATIWTYTGGVGLLVATGSGPIVALGGLVMIGRWQSGVSTKDRSASSSPDSAWCRWLSATMSSIGLCAGLFAIWNLPGLFPIH